MVQKIFYFISNQTTIFQIVTNSSDENHHYNHPSFANKIVLWSKQNEKEIFRTMEIFFSSKHE